MVMVPALESMVSTLTPHSSRVACIVKGFRGSEGACSEQRMWGQRPSAVRQARLASLALAERGKFGIVQRKKRNAAAATAIPSKTITMYLFAANHERDGSSPALRTNSGLSAGCSAFSPA